MVAIEALQRGLVIVASRIEGMQEIVEDGKNGFLCETNPAAFAQRLRALLTNGEIPERMHRASLKKRAISISRKWSLLTKACSKRAH